ncbi:threonine synthase [Caldicellulosiruptoraceae bacterium PP1]
MLYESTRGIKGITSKQAIQNGIASDGGLFIPEKFINIDLNNIIQFNNYKEFAYYILKDYLDDFSDTELNECINNAYNDNKFDKDVVELVKLDNNKFALELWHGPTYAFKDVALQILPHLLIKSIDKLETKKALILVATSGDTGKAALEGFKDVVNTKIIVFYPSEGVSEVQKRQMTTQEGKNTFVAGIKGNFDDAQNGVKEIFTSDENCKRIKDEGYFFTSANSINWGRLIPQIVYYAYSYIKLVKTNEIELGQKVNFVVPTGNFGNVLAGYLAKEMGLPINKLIVASNKNNVLTDFINKGVYDRRRQFYKTISPSMDILIASNLERLLYLVSNRDSEKIKILMDKLKRDGYYNIEEDLLNKIKDSFYADYSTDAETKQEIKKVYKIHDYLIDTHSAVAFNVYNKYFDKTGDLTKTIILQTANPYKFAYDVLNALEDNKYIDINHFDAIDMLNKITKKEIPQGIKTIREKNILHPNIIEKNEMMMYILEKIKEK